MSELLTGKTGLPGELGNLGFMGNTMDIGELLTNEHALIGKYNSYFAQGLNASRSIGVSEYSFLNPANGGSIEFTRSQFTGGGSGLRYYWVTLNIKDEFGTAVFSGSRYFAFTGDKAPYTNDNYIYPCSVFHAVKGNKLYLTFHFRYNRNTSGESPLSCTGRAIFDLETLEWDVGTPTQSNSNHVVCKAVGGLNNTSLELSVPINSYLNSPYGVSTASSSFSLTDDPDVVRIIQTAGSFNTRTGGVNNNLVTHVGTHVFVLDYNFVTDTLSVVGAKLAPAPADAGYLPDCDENGNLYVLNTGLTNTYNARHSIGDKVLYLGNINKPNTELKAILTPKKVNFSPVTGVIEVGGERVAILGVPGYVIDYTKRKELFDKLANYFDTV